MHEEITPGEVISKMMDTIDRLNNVNEILIPANVKFKNDTAIYDAAVARAKRRATGKTVMDREAEVFLATEQEYLEFKDSKVNVENIKIRVNQINSEIEILRSVSSLLKAEINGTL